MSRSPFGLEVDIEVDRIETKRLVLRLVIDQCSK